MFQVSVSDIGEFVQHKSCQRRFKLDHNHGELYRSLNLSVRTGDIDPVLQASGACREDEWETSLRRAGLVEVVEPYPGERGVDWMDFVQQLDLMPEGIQGFAREVQVEGRIGAFALRGRIDFVVVGFRDGRPYLHLVECKASRKDKTYHRVQATLYRTLVRASLRQMPVFVGGLPVEPDDVQCLVVRVDENSHAIQSILQTQPFSSADAIAADVERLLADDGMLARALRAEVEDLPFQLEARCDACKYAPHCFVTATRRRGLELLSLSPTLVRTLREAGVPDLDRLAALDPSGPEAAVIRQHPDFSSNLEALVLRARAKHAVLTGEKAEARWIPNSGFGQLPRHEVNDLGAHPWLVRVYLNVAYDYVENRIVGISGHVTDSFSPCVVDEDGMLEETGSPLRGTDVVVFKRAPWTGDYAVDNGSELELLQSFFRQVVDAIELTSQNSERASVHFYVWSRYELTQLIEAAGRLGSGLLGALRELFGCRDKLEQLIYSALQFDVTGRYTTGWTSTGLVASVSSTWNDRQFHWVRKIGQNSVDLAQVFGADIFDFVQEQDGRPMEVRAHFADNLPAPYWHAYWGTLPESPESAVFAGAREPYVLESYLLARAHALRWIEDGIVHKNASITKKPVVVRDLPRFKLGTENAVQAALDFLRFDQHVGYTDWVRDHLVPPWVRVANGQSVPVKNLRIVDERGLKLRGQLDATTYGLTTSSLKSKTGLEVGAFVRLNEVQDPHQGVSATTLAYGRTCRVDAVNWDSGIVELSVILSRDEDLYMPRSWGFSDKYPPYRAATLDASIADFVSYRVEDRLVNGPGRRVQPLGAHVIEWFDPSYPTVPAMPARPVQAELVSMLSPRMLPERVQIVLEGLAARIQLVQGPPGTGKTTLTSAAILARLLVAPTAGVVVLASNTHTAVDTLLARTAELLKTWPEMRAALHAAKRLPVFFKVGGEEAPAGVQVLSPMRANVDAQRDQLNGLLRSGRIPVVGGTTGGVLKFGGSVGTGLESARGQGFLAPLLVVDEASMMPFAHFLSLASHVHPDGQIMLAGDHRQLSPIVSHDWAREDRPPAVLYHPHVSAFEAVRALAEKIATMPRPQGRVVRHGLEVTYRLPTEIRKLIQPVYSQDLITLRSPDSKVESACGEIRELSDIWTSGSLFLILHDEMGSRNSNRFEVELARAVLESAPVLPDASVAVMTPHRAQRAMLKDALVGFSRQVAMIDTVERMQGGECPTILFSATVSDPVAITQNESFILDLNRSNVAFSRTKERLIVLCSRALLDHIPDTVEAYEAAVLWKLLRQRCSRRVLELRVDGGRAEVWVPG